jgi:hypothetical protein
MGNAVLALQVLQQLAVIRQQALTVAITQRLAQRAIIRNAFEQCAHDGQLLVLGRLQPVRDFCNALGDGFLQALFLMTPQKYGNEGRKKYQRRGQRPHQAL